MTETVTTTYVDGKRVAESRRLNQIVAIARKSSGPDYQSELTPQHHPDCEYCNWLRGPKHYGEKKLSDILAEIGTISTEIAEMKKKPKPKKPKSY